MSTINKTIALDGSGDALTIQDAFDLCLNDGNDYVLTILDFGPYVEQAVLAARAAGGKVTLQADSFGPVERPVMSWSGSDGAILTLNANHYIKGIKFVYDEPVQGADFRYCIKSNAAGIQSEVSHCQFWMGARYHWDVPPPIDEFGHVGYWAEYNTAVVKVWNCLFRACGYAGVRYDPKAGNDIDIYFNTFAKCEECVWIESRVLGVQSIHDNIFDLDGTYNQDCWKFAGIYLNETGTPAQVGGLDYNLYNNRATGTRLPPMGSPTQLEAFTSWNVGLATRAIIAKLYPTQEVHGVDGDPLFCIYCQDYRLRGISPPVGLGLHTASVTDDMDGYPRLNPPSIGCYEFNPYVMPETFFPMPDAGDQSDPFNIFGEDQTVAQ